MSELDGTLESSESSEATGNLLQVFVTADTIDQLISSLVKTREVLISNHGILETQRNDLTIERNRIEQERALLLHDQEQFRKEVKELADLPLSNASRIDLNVGGITMTTTKHTLCSIKNTMLSVMFSGRHVLSRDG
eukprot:TRINITY_DN5561_c0_g3_i1.p1 TRINITY_DN5561_c0_g3~~TRINITY_DN5561_c0_g3_i1.p1  ORF type:complete len:136 (-),score=15.27 TRINITY_DN5561_c0_g3_i1:16-423(-)